MGSNGTTVRKVGLVAVLALALTSAGAAPGGSSPSSGARPARAAAAVTPRLLVPLRVLAPTDVDVADDGTVFAADPSTGRVLVQSPDHPPHLLDIDELQRPASVAAAADGTAYVGDGARVRSLAPDGTQADLDLPGLAEVTALDVDEADGSLLVADPSTPQILRVAPDGTQTSVDLDGRTRFAGVAAGEAGDVQVLDLDAGDVAVLHPDGTSDLLGLDADLSDPVALDVRDGVTAVSQAGSVLRYDGGLGSVRALPIERPGGIAIGPDGDVYVATSPDGSCRCPEPPGTVLRDDGAEFTTIGFGDVATIPALSAAEPGTVVFSSARGPLGYSDPNPLREVVGDGPAADLGGAEDGSYLLAAAPDGTRYTSTGTSITRTAPGGATSPVAVPAEPGMDQVVDLAVDEAGRLFVALGSGYGTGAVQIVEPLAAGGPATWYRSSNSDQFHALGAGGGTVLVAATPDGVGDLQLLELAGDGTAAVRAPLGPYPVDDLAVDQAGLAFLVSLEDPARIVAVPRSGSPSTVTYAGQRAPSRLSVGTDGTLYVVDAEVGLLALDGVGATGTPGGPAAPAPAVPVAGDPSYTG